MPESILGIPFEYYLVSIGLLMLWASFKASHNKNIARASLLSFAYTLIVPVIVGWDEMKNIPFLYHLFGIAYFVFLGGAGIWMTLDLVSGNPLKTKQR